ncbi:MAG: fused MFS/spermidine synthase [Burkholderiales bacterium]|nr:fused MFS/spermidine synthase [Burkholderiales bacterium]
MKPFIYETLTSKSLFFSSHHIQSSMHILQPDELQFEYTRLMMGFLLFNPHPRKLLMIGLGGGSLAKFCHRYLPQTHITVVEINPYVIALRRDFAVPDDDERFAIIQDDAAKYVCTTDSKFDVLLADGFDISGLPEQLSTRHFYENCRNILSHMGVFIANLHRCNQWFDIYIDRMSAAFDAPLLKVNDPGATNCIAFAIKDDQWQDGNKVGMRRPQHIEEQAWKEILPSIARVFLAARELRRCDRMPQLQPG